MSVVSFLDNYYSELSSFTKKLYFFPFSDTHIFFASRETRAHSKKIHPFLKNYHGAMSDENKKIALLGQKYANRVTFLLLPILLPLTIATFALALAISIAALLTKLITCPIAGLLDSVASPSF